MMIYKKESLIAGAQLLILGSLPIIIVGLILLEGWSAELLLLGSGWTWLGWKLI